MKDGLIGVVGAGVMGSGIAQFFAEQDRDAVLWDTSPEGLADGMRNIQKRLERSAARGKLPPERVPRILQHVHQAEGLRDLASAVLVIEAVVEDTGVKKRVFAELESTVSTSAVLATNTSSLCVTEMSAALRCPARFVGVHFFNPPTKLELVEVIRTPVTAPEVLDDVLALLRACGKTPVTVKDSPGFIVNRLLLLLVNEAVRMVDEGIATAQDIDTAMQLGALHPAGPLAVADLIGLDICERILGVLHDAVGTSSYEAASSIKELVRKGQLGRKTGRGFFEYE